MVTEASPVTKYGKVTQRHLLGDIDCLSLVSFTVICICSAIKHSLKQEGHPLSRKYTRLCLLSSCSLSKRLISTLILLLGLNQVYCPKEKFGEVKMFLKRMRNLLAILFGFHLI